jgi:peptide/nickel transport system substrate-binding protein
MNLIAGKNRLLSASLVASLLAAALAAAAPAHAQTLRWSSQGDPLTMDPHSQNEGLTNMMNGQIYEYLVARDKQLGLVPQLATEWKQISPLVWRFKLRPNVKFHDGKPFSADDVVFSLERAKQPPSQIASFANPLGEARKIDDLTVEFRMQQFNPIFLQHINRIQIMSKAWCEQNKATRAQDFAHKEEAYTVFNANGTGPFMLVSRQPDVKTVLKRFPGYWGAIEGNLQDVVYTPIKSAPTRTAALMSGELDFVLDPPPADLERLRSTPTVKVVEGVENRVVFIGMDQARDELLYSSVKGKNPLKDVRVRRALYQAIDIDTLKTRLMNGQSVPTGAVMASTLGTFNDPEIEKRLPFNVDEARKLLADAGYADGFEVTLDCPNNRYINDERICLALSSMWAKVGVKVRVNAMPRSTYFPKLEKLDTSMYMMGWGSAITDAETTFTPIYRNRADKGVGSDNYGNYRNDKLDALAAASSREEDPAKRQELIKAVFREHNEKVHHIPLHRQFVPWAMRPNVSVVHRADNWLELRWVSVK